MRVLTIDEITRATPAAWQLERAVYAERMTWQGGRSDVVACSRTAVATIYRYSYPGDEADGKWLFSVEERRHRPADLTGVSYPSGLIAAADEVDFDTWRECFDAAFRAVRELRGCA